jgi:uncharacterized protein (DUF1778 family)
MADENATQKLGSPISVEFTPDGRQAIRRAAYLSERSLSAFIRQAALDAAARVNEKAMPRAA